MKGKRLQQVIGFLISALLVYFVIFKPAPAAWLNGTSSFFDAWFGTLRFSSSDMREIARRLEPGSAILATLLLVFSLFLRAWRWQLIMRTIGKTRFWLVFHSVNIGYLFNNVLPLRAGEFLRGMLVARRSGLSSASIVTTVILERLFDVGGLALLFGMAVVFYPFPDWIRIGGGILSAGVAGAMLAGWVLSRHAVRVNALIESKIAHRGKWFHRVAGLIERLIAGLGILQKGTMMLHMVWMTMGLWIIYSAIMKLVFDAFGFTDGQYPLLATGHGWVQGVVMTIVTALGMSIPSAPGAVGTYHGAAILGLSWFNLPSGLAVLFATAVHGLNYLTLSTMGVIGLWRLKLSWGDMIRTAKGEADPLTESKLSAGNSKSDRTHNQRFTAGDA